MKQTNTISEDELSAINELIIPFAKAYCDYTGAKFKKELKKIDGIDLSSYDGNLFAISTFLQYLYRIERRNTYLDRGPILTPKSGEVIVTKLLNTQVLVELLQPGQERSRAERELEYNTNEAGGVYLVVRSFVDFAQQFGSAISSGKMNT